MPDISNKSADNLMKDFEKLKSEQMAFFNNISKVKPLTLDSILNTPAPNGSSVAGDSESFRLQLKKIEADTKAKELETPAVARYIGTGDTLKAIIIWSIALTLVLALILAMLLGKTDVVGAILPVLATVTGFLVGAKV
ncbi:hypothetical protein [Cloacibacillus evryensis]|uniref:hypothetical protein n=1 Tax=Cloacibacillus evryensis TaxID=508460 RepID=UPI00241D6B72|nr:hypothetical protein [Cloacibacillus evryensis]